MEWLPRIQLGFVVKAISLKPSIPHLQTATRADGVKQNIVDF
jgi:hypothetical protein